MSDWKVGDKAIQENQEVEIIAVSEKWAIVKGHAGEYPCSLITLTPPKPKQFEPEGGGWYITACGDFAEGYSAKDHRKFGMERKTKGDAEDHRDYLKRVNTIAAWKDKYCPDYEWTDGGDNYCVMCSKQYGIWTLGLDKHWYNPSTTYMPRVFADQLRDELNAGIVEIELPDLWVK